jgi:hypothetical protein
MASAATIAQTPTYHTPEPPTRSIPGIEACKGIPPKWLDSSAPSRLASVATMSAVLVVGFSRNGDLTSYCMIALTPSQAFLKYPRDK